MGLSHQSYWLPHTHRVHARRPARNFSDNNNFHHTPPFFDSRSMSCSKAGGIGDESRNTG